MKDSSLGAMRTTSPYFWWRSLIAWPNWPPSKAWKYGIRVAAYDFGPGNFAKGWK